MIEKFKQLGISETILNALEEMGFEEPTEIQEKSIPLVLEGKDVIAGASTGSGKTLAFGCGIIENAKPDFGIQGLILTPTRELVEQIKKELRKFSKYKKLKIVSVYGGMSMLKQIEELKSAEIVVATPGRMLDHLGRKTIDLQYVNTLVLDEADRMFDMGFKDDVEKIISQCPKKRQTLLYSATISSEIVMLTEKHMNNAVEVSAEPHVDPSKLSQVYYDVEDGLKFSLLSHLLENEKSDLVMVFCNTRRNVDFVANNLKRNNIEALPIHGGFNQKRRNQIMELFHSTKVHVLICTDVAARGLDIKGVTHIYNYDMPKEAKEYVHRIGRTARAGKEGKVINIIASRDYDNFRRVLGHYDEFKINREETPYIQKVPIKWMAEKRSYDRDSKGRGYSRYGGNSRGQSRGPSRGRSEGSSSGSYGRRSEGSSNRFSSYRGSSSRARPSSYGNRSTNRRPSSYGGRDSNRKPRSYGERSNDSRGDSRGPRSNDKRSYSSRSRGPDRSSDRRPTRDNNRRPNRSSNRKPRR